MTNPEQTSTNLSPKTQFCQSEENQQSNRWHVKLYQLNDESQWDDNGTGFVFFSNKNQIINNNIIKTPRLIMTKENSNQELFNIDLNENIEFHNQRGTILTWKTDENYSEDNIAISFQRKEDISEIWKNICLIKGIDPDPDSFINDDSIDIIDVNLNNLSYIEYEIRHMDSQKFFDLENYIKNSYGDDDFIKKLGVILEQEEKKLEGNFSNFSQRTNFTDNHNINPNENNNNNNIENNNDDNKKDHNCNNENREMSDTYIDNNNLISKKKNKDYVENINNNNLIENEKMQQIENLSLIFLIFKNLILQADQSLIEFLLNDEHYLITFGAFEFDFETQKVIPHRKYFKEIVKFKNILNIKNEELLEKIHLNHRLSYLRDTAIGRFIEDNPLRTINSMISLNNNYIIQFFMNDTDYLRKLFSLMESKDIEIRKDACLFLVELINCPKDFIQIKLNFCETISELGILPLIEKIINEIPNETPYQKYIDSIQMKKNIDIITEYNNKKEDENLNETIKISLIEILISILTSDAVIIKDYLIQNNSKLIVVLCRLMLCNENFGIKYEISHIMKTLIENDIQGKKNSFDNLIFVEALIILVKYLDIPLNSNFKKEIESNKQIIIEILCHVISQYNSLTQYWLDQNNVCNKIINLIGVGSKILDLYSIKFIKCILMYCDIYFIQNFLNKNVFSKIQKLFEENKKKENLIFSCVCDLFDYSVKIKSEQILVHFFTFDRDFFYDENNRKYFQRMINKYERKEPINTNDQINTNMIDSSINGYDQKELNEREDEDYFTDDKDFYLEKKRNPGENYEELFDNLYNSDNKKDKNDLDKNKKIDDEEE
jgi:hypothetical protein